MRLKTIISSLSVLIMLLSFSLVSCTSSEKIEKTENDSQAEPKSHTVETIATDSISALDLLLENHEVVSQSSLMGAFVSGIDGVENSTAGYWVYKVNDTTPKIACDKMILLPGDRVKWLFQSSDETETSETE